MPEALWVDRHRQKAPGDSSRRFARCQVRTQEVLIAAIL